MKWLSDRRSTSWNYSTVFIMWVPCVTLQNDTMLPLNVKELCKIYTKLSQN